MRTKQEIVDTQARVTIGHHAFPAWIPPKLFILHVEDRRYFPSYFGIEYRPEWHILCPNTSANLSNPTISPTSDKQQVARCSRLQRLQGSSLTLDSQRHGNNEQYWIGVIISGTRFLTSTIPESAHHQCTQVHR